MKNILYLVILVIGISCDKPSQEDEIYPAVNQLIKDLEGEEWVAEGKPSYNYLLDKPSVGATRSMEGMEKVLSGETIRKYFSESDINTLKKQVEQHKNTVYDDDKIVNKKLLSSEKLTQIAEKNWKNFWNEYEQLYGKTGYYNISIPIFSVDGQRMLVSIETCGFKSSSNGGIYVFKKQDGKWVFWKPISGFLS